MGISSRNVGKTRTKGHAGHVIKGDAALWRGFHFIKKKKFLKNCEGQMYWIGSGNTNICAFSLTILILLKTHTDGFKWAKMFDDLYWDQKTFPPAAEELTAQKSRFAMMGTFLSHVHSTSLKIRSCPNYDINQGLNDWHKSSYFISLTYKTMCILFYFFYKHWQKNSDRTTA